MPPGPAATVAGGTTAADGRPPPAYAAAALRGGTAALPAASASAAADILDPNGTPPRSSELLKHIQSLKRERKKMKADAKPRIARELETAEKRPARLRKKATQWTVTDLVEVLQMRASAAAAGTPEVSDLGARAEADGKSLH